MGRSRIAGFKKVTRVSAAGLAIELQPTYFLTFRFEASLQESEMPQRLEVIGATLDRHGVHMLLRLPRGKELSRYGKHSQQSVHAFWDSRLCKKGLIVDLDVLRLKEIIGWIRWDKT